jgi:hypothetical protein
MSDREIQSVREQLLKLSYDGTTPVQAYLNKFNFCACRLRYLDPDLEDEELRMWMYIQLQNAKKPPAVGLDGERYVGPETWVVRQPDADIDTYEKLSSALKQQYKGREKKTSQEVIREIEQMHPNWKKITLKEFFASVDELFGSVTIEEWLVIRSINEKLPAEVKEELRRTRGAWKQWSFTQYREFCLNTYKDIHHPDPTLLGRGRSMDADTSKQELQVEKDKVTLLQRQVEELNLLNKHHIDAQKRFANSDDAKCPPRQRDEATCWNCWETGHVANTCQPRRTWSEREALRQRKGYPAPYGWEKMLREGIEKDATYSRKKEVNYLRQQFPQFNEDEEEDESLQTFNVSHHAAPAKRPTPREKVDTVFPEPQERNRHRQKGAYSHSLNPSKFQSR